MEDIHLEEEVPGGVAGDLHGGGGEGGVMGVWFQFELQMNVTIHRPPNYLLLPSSLLFGLWGGG